MSRHNSRIRNSLPKTEQAARSLRRRSTPAEARLWEALRRRKLAGYKFRRQHPVGRFILDFYCPELKLVIEIDGGIHEHQKDYDEDRTAQLEASGDRVLRFSNDEVLHHLPTVLERILGEIAGRSR
ncbi:endonuclease domain-containing protein [Lyngbya confervoides]|uniref:Endonuclease domain-containing protein n=1 Tax=Lyngbya confervoides BDU141951 TaxID=1574623 RepID=A0ABD4T5L2_9CYAN|nr:endonuclease domain-containing protein [Lyngbya confervoides]MCM1983973.1 endonuclease domain-containing protein [Lyngbya confervoides BDU141951]